MVGGDRLGAAAHSAGGIPTATGSGGSARPIAAGGREEGADPGSAPESETSGSVIWVR